MTGSGSQRKPKRLVWDVLPIVGGLAVLFLVDVAFEVSLLDRKRFVAFAVFVAAMAFVPTRPLRFRALKVAIIALAALLIGAIDWTVEKKFVRAFQQIEPGMGAAQARTIMRGFPHGAGNLSFRPTAAPGDANWGMVEIGDDGRVVATTFSPD